MKKIVISLIIPLFFIIVVWLINFQLTYGDLSLLSQTHLDLKTMFERFSLNSDLSTDFAGTFRSMMSTMKSLSSTSVINQILEKSGSGYSTSTGWVIALNGLESLANPLLGILYPVVLLGYLMVLVLQFLGITSNVATAIFDFIFNPVFIVNNSTYITPIVIPDNPPILPPII